MLPPENELYEALVERDASYEGIFFACVRTTGIFCRPTCRARKPRRENVEFVPDVAAALHAGYRPCKVCRPLEPATGQPEWAAQLVAAIERDPARRLTDTDLRRRGLHPARVRRVFQQHYGVTFHAYQRALRLGTAMRSLARGASISAAAYDSGFESESGFREAFRRLFGAPPGAARTRDCLLAHWLRTPLGPMIAVASDDGLALLEFVDRRALETELRSLGRTIVPGTNDLLMRLDSELAGYFAGERSTFTVPVDTPATPFQQRVWDRLREIPCGETRSYRDIATKLEQPGAVRAVGRANGQNRVAILVPCHRVVGADGSLTGYGGGLWRKRYLLDLESAGSGTAASACSRSLRRSS